MPDSVWNLWLVWAFVASSTGACTETTVVAYTESADGGNGDEKTDGDVVGGIPGGCVRLVDVNSTTSSPDGLRWSTAYSTVQEAIDDASQHAPCEVWVAQGTYVVYVSKPEDSVLMRQGVDVYGGFSGSESLRSERDWEAHRTVLDGAKNVFHVVTGNHNAVLDGFTVRGGNACGSGSEAVGGGMYNYAFVQVSVFNCIFSSNSALGNGGGVYNESVGFPTFENCTFMENSSVDSGGGMYTYSGSLTLTNCVFWKNSAVNTGGGVASMSASTTAKNCTFAANSAVNGGGGIETGAAAATNVINSILWSDSPDEIHNSTPPSSATLVAHSNVQGGYPGTGNIDDDPLFENGNLYLGAGSPCIDAADGDFAPATDIEGKPRYDDPSTANAGTGSPRYVDMGAYEYQP